MTDDEDQSDDSSTASSDELRDRAAIEKAKAVQAVAKAADHGLDLAEGLGQFLYKVFGASAEQFGGMLEDWVRFRRENVEKTRRKAERILDLRGVKGELRHLPLKLGIPLLEQASLEDDDLLQDMWASLIANSVDPNTSFTLRKLFISILSELEPLDVRVLRHLCSTGWAAVPGPHGGGYTLAKLQNELNLEEWDLKFSLLNLFRNGLLMDQRAETMDSLDMTQSGLRVHDKKAFFQATSLGHELFRACSPTPDDDDA